MPNGDEMKSIPFLLVAAALTACASSGPVQTGKDTYMIAKTSAGGVFVQGSSVKAEIIGEASAFCTKNGKTIEMVNGTSKNAIPFARMPSAEIVFKCV
jgi:hypothetical protein